MNKFFNLKKTLQVALSAALLWAIWSILPSVDRWNGGAGIALYFVGLLVGLLTLGLVVAPSREKSDGNPENLINRYGECLEKSDHFIRDIRELPASKEKIGEAILLSMTKVHGKQALDALGAGFVELAKFQHLTPRQKRAVRIYSAGPGTELEKLMDNPKIALEILAEVTPLLERDHQERETREAKLAEFKTQLARLRASSL